MRKTVPVIFAALAVAVVVLICIALHRFNGTLHSARVQVAREGSLDFTLEPVAPPSEPVFEPVGADSAATDAAAFQGKLYVAGPSGVEIYDSANSIAKTLRTGVDLPAATIAGFAVAHVRGQPGPELLAITSGAGLLLFDGNGPPRQLLPSSLDARDLTAMLPLASGEVLLGTRRAGLLIFDGNQLRRFSPLLAKEQITSLVGNETEFWIGTRDRGVAHWHSGQLEFLGTDAGLPDDTVLSLAESPRGVFVGTPVGIVQVVDGSVNRQIGRGLFAQSIAVQGDSLLVATLDQGLKAISLKSHAEPVGFDASPASAITKLVASGDDVLALSSGALLRRTSTGIWETRLAAPAHPLTDRNVSALSISPDGRLWVGYFNDGLDVLDLSTGHAQHLEDDHLFCINRIVQDPVRHTMDVATANGLVMLDSSGATPVERQVLTRRDGLAAEDVTDIAFTANGTMLATPAGLTVLTRSGAEGISSFQGLANNHVYALVGDPTSSTVLAGTLAGVSLLDHLSVRATMSLRNSSLPRNWTTAIASAVDGEARPMWFIGTYGGGVAKMDAAGRITRADTPAPNAIINPGALLVTPRHVLAGTLGSGLLVYDRETQHWAQVTEGLPSLSVTAFAISSGGELYIGTANGVARLPEQALP